MSDQDSSGQHVEADGRATAKTKKTGTQAAVTRGSGSWQLLYTTLGFSLTGEGTVVSMVEGVGSIWKILAFLVIAAVTWGLLLHCVWFQNKVIEWYDRNENKFR